jgi:XapX domain-containing protein
MTYILSILTGLIIGISFSLLKLPVLVPEAFAGILAIIGMWLGYALVNIIK